MATNYFRDVWPRVVKKRYDSGGWMVALQEMTIEMDGEPLKIPKMHALSREQALVYPGDVAHVFAKAEKEQWVQRLGSLKRAG